MNFDTWWRLYISRQDQDRAAAWAAWKYAMNKAATIAEEFKESTLNPLRTPPAIAREIRKALREEEP
jgi:hypothetical protein